MSDSRKYLIEPLDPSKHRREEFDCGVDPLDDYLKKRARKEMDAGLAVCFVAVPLTMKQVTALLSANAP